MSLYTQDQIRRIASKISGIPFGMLATRDSAGGLRSRPLDLLRIDEEGNLWLLASDDADFLDELADHPEVNVSCADPGHKRYLSLSGEMRALRDARKAGEFWHPLLRARFPGGPADHHLLLLRLRIRSAEYWDAPSNRAAQLMAIARGVLGGEGLHDVGAHHMICL